MTLMYKTGPNQFKTEEEIERDRVKAEVEELRQQTARTLAAADRQAEKLRIFRAGLKDTPSNDQALETYFPLHLSLEAFRELITANPDLANEFEFRTKTPFAEMVQAEQEQNSEELRNRILFEECCKTAAVAGLASVAPNEANWCAVQEALANANEEITTAAVMRVLTAKVAKMTDGVPVIESRGFAPAQQDQINAWKRDKEQRERIALAKIIAEDTAPAMFMDVPTRDGQFKEEEISRAPIFKKYLNAERYPLETLRQMVRTIEDRRAHRAMPVEALRAVVKTEADKRRAALDPALPADVTPEKIRGASVEQLKKWQRMYGYQKLNDRLNGVN